MEASTWRVITQRSYVQRWRTNGCEQCLIFSSAFQGLGTCVSSERHWLQVRGDHRHFLDMLKLPRPSRPKGTPVEPTNGAGPEGGRQSSEQTHSTPLVSTPHSTAKGE